MSADKEARTLRLILGDQLNAGHSWYREIDDEVVYLIVELHQEASYVKHHIQKLLAFFASMHEFSEALIKAGHRVEYRNLDQTLNQPLPEILQSVCEDYGINRLQYQQPDEYRLRQQLENMRFEGIAIDCVSTEHFLVSDEDIPRYFEQGKATRMESFYRKMRALFDVLMEDGTPEGGHWNFDQDNRNKLKKADLADIPAPLLFCNSVGAIKQRIDRHNLIYFGECSDELLWPVTRKQSLELLEFFCRECLPRFGQFQDAMTDQSPHAWSLYHSRLSFSLNSKMLSPLQVVERAIEEYRSRLEEISLAQIEGFVRQIIGWREFVRGIYWVNMPAYSKMNVLEANHELPDYFWSAKTQMNCMRAALGQSLNQAYAHHIQRLMVIGNFCLLAGIDPDQVDQWYLGVYIDAIEWVEMPNTRGMSQFADDGLLASKPYSASGAYIHRMSDYCSDCDYSVKEKTTENACPFNSLYWHFMYRHKEKFSKNPRLGMVYKNLDRMTESQRAEVLSRAEMLLENLNAL